MTWVYIPSSTVSPDTGDSASASDSPTRTPTSKRSPISNGINTASKSSSNGSEMTRPPLIPLQSGMTSETSTASPGVEQWISSLRDSRASPTQPPDSARGRTMTGTSGPTLSESFARWHPDSLSWKTSPDWQPPQDSISRYLKSNGSSVYLTKTITSRTQGPSIVVTSRLTDTHTWDELSGTFPTSIMMRNGELSVLPPSVRPTSETDGGLWPTPTAWQQQESIESWTERREQVRAKKRNGNGFGVPLDMAARMFPTPNASDAKGTSLNIDHDVNRGYLRGVVHMLPTPSSGGDSGGPHGIRGGSWAKERLVETFGEEDAIAMSGGSLSPDWVSWLMGLPVGWTSLVPLPQEEYDQWLQSQMDGTWWQEEQGLPRVTTGIKDRVNRLKCLGNGIVPASLSLFLRGNC
jgi:hypothetical protein